MFLKDLLFYSLFYKFLLMQNNAKILLRNILIKINVNVKSLNLKIQRFNIN